MKFLALVKKRLGVPLAEIRKGDSGSSLGGNNKSFSLKCFSMVVQNELLDLNGTASDNRDHVKHGFFLPLP